MNFLDVTEENWDWIMRINGLGVLIGIQEAARQMIDQGGGGKIVNTCSITSRQGFDNVAPYCASKFAVLSADPVGGARARRAPDHRQRLRPRRGQHRASGSSSTAT